MLAERHSGLLVRGEGPPDATRHALAATETAVAHAQQAAELARAAADRHATEAAVTPATAASTLETLVSDWPNRRQTAIDDDLNTTGDAPPPRAELARHRAQLQQLRVEQAHRQAMNPADLAQEQIERDAAQARQRERERDANARTRSQPVPAPQNDL